MVANEQTSLTGNCRHRSIPPSEQNATGKATRFSSPSEPGQCAEYEPVKALPLVFFSIVLWRRESPWPAPLPSTRVLLRVFVKFLPRGVATVPPLPSALIPMFVLPET